MDKTAPSEATHSFIKRLLQLIGLAKSPDTAEDLEQEIQELLEDGQENGLISAQEGEMITSIFDFRDKLASEIMTPRAEMACVPETAGATELIGLITEKGFTRLPVYKDSIDHITGVLHAKDLLRYCTEKLPRLQAADIANPPTFIMETQKIGQLLRDFKAKKFHLAIVTDEFGAVRGLVTLEDVLEEIVGEITDEYDKEELPWLTVNPDTIIADAKIDVEEVESFFDTALPDGPYESLGGLLIHQLGRLPVKGDNIELANLRLQVLEADKRRVSKIKISKAA